MALRECKECGHKVSSDAKLCPSCGKRQASSGIGCVGIVGGLILVSVLVAVLRLAFVSSNPEGGGGNSTSLREPTGQKFQRPRIPPPKYRIARQVPNKGLISVVVAPGTTDEQLKSLLWLFREKVRVHKLKELGMTERLESGGIIIVYRGSKCAGEEFVHGLGPCGYGDHNDADYQWGIHGDPNQDEAGIFDKKRQEITAFDSSDNWQPTAQEQKELLEARKQRDDLALSISLSFRQEGFDVTAFADGTTLVLDSKSFGLGSARRAFAQQLLADRGTVNRLCRVGFRSIDLQQFKGILQGSVGNEFSLSCH